MLSIRVLVMTAGRRQGLGLSVDLQGDGRDAMTMIRDELEISAEVDEAGAACEAVTVVGEKVASQASLSRGPREAQVGVLSVGCLIRRSRGIDALRKRTSRTGDGSSRIECWA